MMCISVLSLLFLYLLGGSTAVTDLSPTLVSFGELTEVRLQNGYHARSVASLEADWLNPGGFIVGNQHSVTVISPDLAVTVLAGHENETATADGVGSFASFSTVADTAQYNGGEDIVVADKNNKCIRNVNKASATVTTIAGTCGRSGEIDGIQKARDARLSEPVGVLYREEKDVFYYLFRRPSAIAEHDRTTDNLEQKYSDLDEFEGTWSFIPDSTYSYLYVNHWGGISKISTTDWSRTLVAGLNKTNTRSDIERTDGTLSSARFSELTKMAWLIPDQVLLVNEPGSHSLRVVNLVDDRVSTICLGSQLLTPAITMGGPDECKVYYPDGLLVVNNTIYLGDQTGKDGGTPARRGHILKLPYYQPLCSPPPTANLNGWYEPQQEVYTHLQSINYTCNNGFGISVSYNNITCVKDIGSNETLNGKWDSSPPTCQAAEIKSISPLSGQKNGGTLVTANGTITNKMEVFVEYSNKQRTNVNVTLPVLGMLTFTMPAQVQGTSNDAIIYVEEKFDNKSIPVYNTTYRYLDNPEVVAVSREGSIARGGLQMLFEGLNFDSANGYIFKVFQDSSVVSQAPCAKNSGYIECYTPNVEYLFSNPNVVKRSTAVESLMLHAALYADGEPVSGAANISYPVFNTVPQFDSLGSQEAIRFNSDIQPEIVLTGNNLNISLMIRDYKVTLKTDSSAISCPVTKLERSTLTCQPDKAQLTKFFPIDYNVEAEVMVKVGRVLDETLGEVKFYNLPEVATKGLSQRRSDAAAIAVPVAITVVVILVIVALVLVCKFRHTDSEIDELIKTDDTKGKETTEMEDFISEDVKLKLEDMYIDSSRLTFDIKAEPIGKGHFGNVYSGQLRLKGNILKTVAVKSLKVTEDINPAQLEDFLQEASFVKYYNHANILITLGVVWRRGDRPLVVLPYMALGDLHSLVRKPDMKFTNGDLMHFGMQVATGMEFLSQNKCLHRDLAARNCLVSDTFLVKIGDFGMSRDVYTDNYYRESNKSKPKPAKWMAIESLREGVYNTETEVWSFGVLMWELFTRGGTPYLEVRNEEVFAYLQSGNRLHRPTYTHPYVFDQISKCWDVLPSQRPTFTQLKTFLEECLLNSGENLSEQQNDISDEESFRYSYARDLTRLLPEDYVHNELYEDERMDIDYKSANKLDDYEQPVPDVIAPGTSSTTDHSVYGLDSLPNNHPQALTNDYVLMQKDKCEQPLPKNSLSVDVIDESGRTTPTPQPRPSLTNRNATESADAASNSQVEVAMNEYAF